MKRLTRRAALALAGIAAAVGIGSGLSAPATPTPDRCEAVSKETQGWIASGLNDGVSFNGSLSGVRSTAFEKVWMVSGRLNDGTVGVWAINTITEPNGFTYSINDAAKESSDWIHGDTIKVKITAETDGVSDALICIESGTPVASPIALPTA